MQSELDCPDFKDETFIDNFFDIFKKDKSKIEKKEPDREQVQKPEKKKKSFFQRIFGKKK